MFVSAAALGAGLAVTVDVHTHHAALGPLVTGYVVAVPVAVYLLSVWVLHARPHGGRFLRTAYSVIAVLTLLTPLGPAPVPVIAVLVALLVVGSVLAR